MENLPQELLIEIFKFLSPSDLLNVSPLCRSFNSAINSCNSLMEKFTVRINDSCRALEWKPVRKYSKVFISCENFSDFLPIFESIGGNLRELEIAHTSIDAEGLIKMLKGCERVKILNFHAVKMSAIPENFEVDLPALSLDKFYFLNIHNSTELIFKILGNSQVTELDMLGDFRYPQLLKNFLKSQKNLKSFKIHNQCDQFMLFDDDSLSDVDFRLKELKLNNWDMYNQLSPFFRNFIRHHCESLQIFESNNSKIFNFLPACLALKTVTLPSMHFENLNVYESVENLTITIGSIDRWSSNFPAVKSVKIIQTYPGISDALMEVENCRKIESLELNYMKVGGLNLPNLKDLKVRFMNEFIGCPISAENVKKIEKISIEKCENCDLWLIELLERADLKLKLLSVSRTPMGEKVKEILAKNSTKIEIIEIDD